MVQVNSELKAATRSPSSSPSKGKSAGERRLPPATTTATAGSGSGSRLNPESARGTEVANACGAFAPHNTPRAPHSTPRTG